jgi:putative nucleotidyltransferase with HDIG domain
MFNANWFLAKNGTENDDVFRENQLLKAQIQELLLLEETGFFIELDSLLKAILKKALILCKAESSFFALVKGSPPELDVRISNLILEEKMNRIKELFQVEYLKWVEQESELMTIEDFILLPLIRRHRMLGIMGLRLTSNAPENVCEILPVLAKQAAGSLESAILYERMLKRLLVLSNVFILGKEIITNVDISGLIDKFLAVARDGTQSEVACFFLFHDQEPTPYYVRVQIPTGPGAISPGFTGFSRLIAEVHVKGEARILENLAETPYAAEEMGKFAGFTLRDCIVMPIKAREKLVAVIQLSGKTGKETFNTEDLDLLKILSSQIAFVIQNTDLFKNLQKAYIDTLGALTSAIDAKDSYTLGHSERVTALSVELAKIVAFTPECLENIRIAALLHDIGKIGIPEAILNKPGRLTNEEFEVIKSHPAMGVRILDKVEFLKEIIPIILHHHERFDGRGYPAQLTGDAIPFPARILSIADTFDAMTSDRPYRKALSYQEAMDEIIRCKGTQFDPALADCFVQMIKTKQSSPGAG